MEDHSRAMEDHSGAMENYSGAMEVHHGAMETHPAAMAVVISWPHKEARHDVDVDADTGIVEAHSVNLDTGPSHRSQGGSPWRL
jgi:hypothetical protein